MRHLRFQSKPLRHPGKAITYTVWSALRFDDGRIVKRWATSLRLRLHPARISRTNLLAWSLIQEQRDPRQFET